MKQTQIVIYREFSKNQEEGKEQPELMDLFERLNLQALCQLLGTFMPIVKLKNEDSYLIGTEIKKMVVRGDKCMVRVGGGYAEISDYYNDYATKQCVSLYHIMNAQNCTFKAAILELMQKNSASPEMLDAYQVDDENWESSNVFFCLLATSIEERTSLEKRKSTKKKKKAVRAASGVSD